MSLNRSGERLKCSGCTSRLWAPLAPVIYPKSKPLSSECWNMEGGSALLSIKPKQLYFLPGTLFPFFFITSSSSACSSASMAAPFDGLLPCSFAWSRRLSVSKPRRRHRCRLDFWGRSPYRESRVFLRSCCLWAVTIRLGLLGPLLASK